MAERLLIITFSSNTLLVAMQWTRTGEKPLLLLIRDPMEMQLLLIGCNLLVKVVRAGAGAGAESEAST